jgi:fibronectin type 3 domain-containing protein
VYNGALTVSWDANTEPDLASYKVYVGTASRVYDSLLTRTTTGLSQFVNGLTHGVTYYTAMTAVDLLGNESTYSVEVTKPVLITVLNLIHRVA